MDEPLEGVDATPGLAGPPGTDHAGGRPAMRAAQLWKLLGDDVSSAPPPESGVGPTAGGILPGAREPETPAKSWAGDELGDLLARAWYETVDDEPPPPVPAPDEWSQPAAWEVDRLPSASEGGVAALFGGTRKHEPPAPSTVEVAPVTGEREPAPESGMGRALLAEMIEQLPSEPAPRVTPADIHIDPPVVAPVAIWFWGDDDIYPGRLASASVAPATTAKKKGRTPGKPDVPRRKSFTFTKKSRPRDEGAA